jgi:hypothetical protein
MVSSTPVFVLELSAPCVQTKPQLRWHPASLLYVTQETLNQINVYDAKKYDAGPIAQSTDGVKGPTDVASAALARHELLLPTATVVTPLVNRMC